MPRFATLRRRLEVEILEDRLTPAGTIVPTYTIAQDWGTGLQATMRLTNTQATAVPNWKVEFDYSANITSIWDAQILSRTGSHYVISNAGWNSTLAANGTVSFGFIASPGGAVAPPTNYVFAGVPVSSLPPAPAPVVPLAINAGGGAVGTFGGDTKFTGGTIASTVSAIATAGVTGAAPASVYQSWRQGTFTYTVNGLDAGKSYTVQLHFAENTYTQAGQRAFNVTANGTRLLSSFDVFAAAGGRFKAAVRTFTVAADSAGRLSLAFTAVKNGAILSGLTVQAAAAPANRPPTAVADNATTSAGSAVTVAVLANDTDPDGNPLTVQSNTQGQHGTVAAGAGGALVYTPAAGYSGADAFTYTISDGRGGAATASVNVTITPPPPTAVSSWPAHVFAPYVDTTLWPTFDFVKAARDQGLRYFTLAFIVASPANQPAWGGFSAYGVGSDFSAGIKAQITALRALGGDVAVGFGGASGQELARVITDVTALKNAYQSVIDAYGLTHIDFDIEGAALTDRASIERRFQAIAGLKQTAAAAGKELHISFTLPVLPTGLTADGVALLNAAQRAGVKIDLVNIMAMDYGGGFAPPTQTMGYYAIQAATSLFNQLRQVLGGAPTDAQLWGMIGVTPMIGRNDVAGEVFTQQDAQQLVAFAQQKGLGRLSMWSITRDQQDPAGALGWVSATSSSILQKPFEFSQLFRPFTSWQ